MKINIIGAGPAGLYAAILLKKWDHRHDVTIYERNKPDDTFGFGVVFSDATLDNFATADPPSYRDITQSFAHWDRIDIHYRGEVISSRGHGFAGMSRQRLLDILQARSTWMGVKAYFEHDIANHEEYLGCDLLIASDGVNSQIRTALATQLEPQIDWRSNRFIWLGTTFPFDAFTFFFKSNDCGLWRVHAYRYDGGHSTFIVETTESTWRNAGLDSADEDSSLNYCEKLFAPELKGHRLHKNRSIWRQFPTIKNTRWSHNQVVLLGDAVHTAHFSIGSGTKLAMEDSIALVEALAKNISVRDALMQYERVRRPIVESTQRAAQVSLQWFEETERYVERLEPIQFAFSLMTRSLRLTHSNLKARDPELVTQIDRFVMQQAEQRTGIPSIYHSTPPMFTPFRLRDLVISNRIVVSPMCQYSAQDGVPNDWHLVHLGCRAIGGAGLVMTEMTDVTADGRISPGCTGMYQPEHRDAWRNVVSFVHQHSTAKIGVQLAHAGRKGSTRRLWEGMDLPLHEGNWLLLAASGLPYKSESQVPKAMDRSDMDTIRDDFVRSTQLAEAAGFDLLELHFAHGYLLATFISPLTNVRQDEYGGSLDNRMRYPLEIFDAVRAAWPEHKPISVRISATDWVEGGMTGAESVLAAQKLKEHGCDIVDVSAGQTVHDGQPIYGRLFQTPFSERIRLEVGIPTITVGNIASYSDVNSIIAAGRADLCALARAHLYDPYWTRHAAAEQGYALPWPNQYLSVQRFQPRVR